MSREEIERVQAGPPGGDDQPPSDPPPQDPPRDASRDRETDRDLATKSRSKPKRPPRFKVLLYNDDYTPMEFVVQVLEKIFGKSPSAATQIMLQIHRSGIGIGGVYVLGSRRNKISRSAPHGGRTGLPLALWGGEGMRFREGMRRR